MACLFDHSTTVYRPRTSPESDFHRLLREYFPDFRALYAQRYVRQFGY